MSFLSLLITASVGSARWTPQRRVKCAVSASRAAPRRCDYAWKTLIFAKAENTYENGGGCGGGAVLGLFSRVINKVCGKQRGRRRAFDLLEMAGVFPGEA